VPPEYRTGERSLAACFLLEGETLRRLSKSND
jgi:hypothetical protein